ncbi:MAG: DUF362 domain-containing protein [Melioribacteraceae bacterium]|nr:DUF362 domain-containing protein [Melioribacteraceae bacterium]
MKRRDFISNSIKAGVLLGSAYSVTDVNRLFAQESSNPIFDLAAIKGGSAEKMFEEGISALGGMKNFVKPNQTVVVKPNIGWDVIPENAANTNPNLIGRIVKHCVDAGAKKVYVFDHTCDKWDKCYTNSGIEKAVKDNGGLVVPGNDEKYYQDVVVTGGKSLKETKEHELILESDVFINVPVLKDHRGTKLSISMKNLMGIVWDRKYWHSNDLAQCIADFASYRKPDLNIVDAYAVMKRNGPRGVSKEDVILSKSQIISTDIVAADSAAAKLFGKEPDKIEHIKLADEMKAGTMDLSKLNIKRIKIS